MAKILLIEHVHELRELRRRGLSTAGHSVVPAQNFAEGLRAIQSGKYDVVVLGHAIPRQQRNNLAAAAKKASPLTRVLVLYSARVDQAELADALMDNTASAEDLRRTVEYLVDTRTR